MTQSSILKNFSKLTYTQQTELLQTLTKNLSQSRPILTHKKLDNSCPYCQNPKVHKHGTYKNGGTRFKCPSCQKTFNELSGTSIHRVHKKQEWDQFIQLMLECKSIREISKELHLSTKTVFNWRHKVLSSFNNLFTKEFKGVVETDDVFFRFNQKGQREKIDLGPKKRGVSKHQVSVLFTMDRYKTYDFKVVKLGKLDGQSLRRVIDTKRFNSENIICSDSEQCFITLFQEMGLEHKFFKSEFRHGVDKVYHINNLNNTVNHTKKWITKNFGSVSTKYLGNYLNWFSVLEILKNNKEKNGKFWDYVLLDSQTYNRYREGENNYHKLLKLSKVK